MGNSFFAIDVVLISSMLPLLFVRTLTGGTGHALCPWLILDHSGQSDLNQGFSYGTSGDPYGFLL
jgi:hypothetical protein